MGERYPGGKKGPEGSCELLESLLLWQHKDEAKTHMSKMKLVFKFGERIARNGLIEER